MERREEKERSVGMFNSQHDRDLGTRDASSHGHSEPDYVISS